MLPDQFITECGIVVTHTGEGALIEFQSGAIVFERYISKSEILQSGKGLDQWTIFDLIN